MMIVVWRNLYNKSMHKSNYIWASHLINSSTKNKNKSIYHFVILLFSLAFLIITIIYHITFVEIY